MSTLIICPNCNHQFEPTQALANTIREDLRKELNQKWVEQNREKENNFRLREEQLARLQDEVKGQKEAGEKELKSRLDEERRKMTDELTGQLRKQMTHDYENKLRMLEDANKTNELKLTAAREKELEFLKRMQELQAREQELDLQVQRQVLEERTKLAETIRKEEDERAKLRDSEYQMKMKEKDMQLEGQMKLIAEMQRKIEQGSMQLQGEAQELALEELLKANFPFDVVSEVGKGVRGADCVMTIRNGYGQECGKIIFESKRTKDFSEDWIEKLKADSRSLNADIAVIVTQAMPKSMDCFGERNGVWICNFSEVKPVIHVLRDLIIKVYNAGKSQQNKGDKMSLLYSYLVSTEFAEQWSAIREGFLSMKMSIQKERDQMEKLWKAREKQLEKVLLNAAHIRGSIEGISGMDVDLELMPGTNDNLLE
jgi:hypothetical protein